MDLKALQVAVGQWSRRNFCVRTIDRGALLVCEEAGELAHHVLKSVDYYREDEDHIAGMEDAVGDIVVSLADFCDRAGLNLDHCVEMAWRTVQKRDWRGERKQ